MSAIRLTSEISLDDLAHQLVDDTSYEALYQLIVSLDLMTADWDFTHRLAKHFAALEKQYQNEVAQGTDTNSIKDSNRG